MRGKESAGKTTKTQLWRLYYLMYHASIGEKKTRNSVPSYARSGSRYFPRICRVHWYDLRVRTTRQSKVPLIAHCFVSWVKSRSWSGGFIWIFSPVSPVFFRIFDHDEQISDFQFLSMFLSASLWPFRFISVSSKAINYIWLSPICPISGWHV